MNLLGQFDLSLPAVLITVYGILLLISLFLVDLMSRQDSPALDFTCLLDELEPVWDDSSQEGSSNPSLIDRHSVLSDKERLRRISRNARVLARLSRIDNNWVSPEALRLAWQLRKEVMRLGFVAWLVQFAVPATWRIPGVGLLLGYVGRSYWNIVRRLFSYFYAHHVRQSAAFSTACNLADSARFSSILD